MRILIAGGSGFIGSHLVDHLLDQDHLVTVIDNFITGRPRNLAHRDTDPRLEVIKGDVCCPSAVSALGPRFDRVFHLASPASPVGYGRYPLETLRVNSVGTWNLLELAQASAARFLLTSTSETYGDPLVHPQVETYWGNVNPVGPRSCYDEGKRFAESLTVNYGRQNHLDVRIARIFNTYGPRSAMNDGRMIPNFCVQALNQEPLTIFGDGSQTRSLCYLYDTVVGLHKLMEADGATGEVVNLGNPTEHTVLEIADRVIRAAGSSSKMTFHPLPTDDPVRRKPDIRKAKRLLQWKPEIEFSEGLPRTLDYFRRELSDTALSHESEAFASTAS